MAVTLTTIKTKVRYLIEDNLTTQSPGDSFTYANSSVFTLTESNVSSISSVLVNDTATTGYTYNSTNNKVTITDSLSTGDTIEVQYTYYSNYSDTEIQNHVRAALIHISANNYKTFIVENSTIYPEPSRGEQDLISLVTATLIEPDNKTIRMSKVSVVVPGDLPTNQKISKIISLFKRDGFGIFKVL